ncbi:general secretion pathway protein GspB [Desulfobacterium sp. N47]|uniref:Type II secretion system protein GspB C-terminal domain-containing protein n=1 Tax=uncultured Desulfobacterium sp. TaxID=201089 RepID=E1YFJ1_9BACT|nr:hypothetical protein N47_J03160 [uncultured Desulfobacterium sp.]
MSVILDALKKLDREKSYRKNGVPDISEKILDSDPYRPLKRIRLYFFIVVLTVLVTFAVTYTVMVRFGFLAGPSASEPANPVSLNQQAKPVLPESELQMESFSESVTPPAKSLQVDSDTALEKPAGDIQNKEPRMQAKSDDSVKDKTHIKTVSPVKTKPLPERKQPMASNDERKAVVSEKAKSSVKNVINNDKAASNASAATLLPSLKLSAIVWYEDPSLRFAMINGIKAVEGSEIEGVKVVKITPAGIRILVNGGYHEISMAR